jgi:hypothetical protein
VTLLGSDRHGAVVTNESPVPADEPDESEVWIDPGAADDDVLELGAGWCDFSNLIEAGSVTAMDIDAVVEKAAADHVRPFLPLSMKSKASRLSFLVPLYLRSPIKPLAGQMLVVATSG